MEPFVSFGLFPRFFGLFFFLASAYGFVWQRVWCWSIAFTCSTCPSTHFKIHPLNCVCVCISLGICVLNNFFLLSGIFRFFSCRNFILISKNVQASFKRIILTLLVLLVRLNSKRIKENGIDAGTEPFYCKNGFSSLPLYLLLRFLYKLQNIATLPRLYRT